MHTQFRNANKMYKCTQDSEMHRTRLRNVFLMHTQIYLDLQTACGLWTSLHLCVNFETALTWLDIQMPFFKQGMICNQSDISLVLANHKNAPHVGDCLLISQLRMRRCCHGTAPRPQRSPFLHFELLMFSVYVGCGGLYSRDVGFIGWLQLEERTLLLT